MGTKLAPDRSQQRLPGAGAVCRADSDSTLGTGSQGLRNCDREEGFLSALLAAERGSKPEVGPGQGKGEGPGSQLAWPEKREVRWGLLGLDTRWGVHWIRRSMGLGEWWKPSLRGCRRWSEGSAS